MSEKIAYPGNFQPFHSSHLEVLENMIDRFPNCEIVIAVAEARKESGRKFLDSDQALEVVRLSLKDAGLDNSRIKSQVVSVNPDMPVAWAKDLISKERITIVCTGSERTKRILNLLREAGSWNGRIIELSDKGLHAVQIRDWVKNGDIKYKLYLSPSSVKLVEEELNLN